MSSNKTINRIEKYINVLNEFSHDYIKEHYKFNRKYHSGWYPVTTHILNSCDYRESFDMTYTNVFVKSAGILQGTLSSIPEPNEVTTVNIGMTSTGVGDWQFSTTHTYIYLPYVIGFH